MMIGGSMPSVSRLLLFLALCLVVFRAAGDLPVFFVPDVPVFFDLVGI
jgi:hypothetical protein